MLTLVPAPLGYRYAGPRKWLVAELNPKGRKAERQYHATRLVIDDYGDAVAYERRCFSCMRWGAPYERGACRECSVFIERSRRGRADDDARAAVRERRRLERRSRMEADPSERERERQRERASRAARFAADPERERQLARDRSARYLDRLRQDQQRNKERLELMRIDSCLRRLRLGLPTGDGRGRRLNGTGAKWVRRTVASAPLAVAVARAAAAAALDGDPTVGERMVAEQAGLSPRLLWSWRLSNRHLPAYRSRVSWDVADLVLVAIDRFWWEVFDPQAADRGLFSGVRSCDVAGWVKVALDAVDLWGDVGDD